MAHPACLLDSENVLNPSRVGVGLAKRDHLREIGLIILYPRWQTVQTHPLIDAGRAGVGKERNR
jgi:hypothetical protein